MKQPIIFLLSFLLLAACGVANLPSDARVDGGPDAARTAPVSEPEVRQLTIFAAASLADAFTEIGHTFEAGHPGTSVTFIFSGSQTLSAQLIQGAEADVFACANHAEMDKLVNEHLVAGDAPRDFVVNKLVVILPAGNPANVYSLQDLARPGLKLILADVTVPAGKYAREILVKMSQAATFGTDYSAKVLPNVVSYETDVKLVVAKVQLGEADAGIAYFSDAAAAPELRTIEIPPEFNVIARYPIAVLENSSQADLAAKFIAYVLSADGKAILQKWGFNPAMP